MTKLITILGLFLSFHVLAQAPLEPSWKTKVRSVISQVAGEKWGVKLLGPVPEVTPEITLPEIPKDIKKSTDVASYTKLSKEPTEFDRLPTERRRQFDYKFIEELFQVTRKTEAKDEDLSNWLNTLDQGGSREGIYQALVLDEVYNGLESIEGHPSAKLMNFCLKFSQKYLNETFKEESLKQLNHYSLKRIFTEKGLDLLEHFEVKNLDDLYRWYAVFSAEIAREYPSFLKSQVRLETSEAYHYEWAKSMPIQHIKSEYIIKMHSVMNGLQMLN